MTAGGHAHQGRMWPRVIVVAALLLTAGAAWAENLVYEHQREALFSIDVAEGWLVDLDFAQEAREAGVPEGEEPKFRVVEISPEDGSHVWLGIWALPDVRTLDEGVAYLKSLRQDLFSDVEMAEPVDTELNGMAARTNTGKALREGAAVELAMALFVPRADVVVAVLYVGEPDAWQAYRTELESMVQSLASVAP